MPEKRVRRGFARSIARAERRAGASAGRGLYPVASAFKLIAAVLLVQLQSKAEAVGWSTLFGGDARKARASCGRYSTRLHEAHSALNASKNPGQDFDTQPGSSITTPGTRKPASANDIAMR